MNYVNKKQHCKLPRKYFILFCFPLFSFSFIFLYLFIFFFFMVLPCKKKARISGCCVILGTIDGKQGSQQSSCKERRERKEF